MYAKRIFEVSSNIMEPGDSNGVIPEGNSPFKNLACAIIYDAAKCYAKSDGRKCGLARSFFESEDYDFWAIIAGIEIDGSVVMDALDRNGGKYLRSMESVCNVGN